MGKKKLGRVLALVGGQFGSEGKGVVAARMANTCKVHVRTGGPNAGHSFVKDGKIWKMQAVPCGWTNPDALIVIGPGAVVNMELLNKEVSAIAEVDPTIVERLVISSKAGVLEQRHHDAEGGVQGEMHDRIGSTGEGVGVCRIDRIRRNKSKFRLVGDLSPNTRVGGVSILSMIIDDVPSLLANYRLRGDNVMLEGTQGYGLSMVHGDWPYVTSADTNAAQLAADAGVPPHHVTDVIMVIRTHPIRVAGNSGPLRGEVSWEEMSQKVGKAVKEHTTVTKKPRRIGQWDPNLVLRAGAVNGPTAIALTFMDYMFPGCENTTELDKLPEQALAFVSYVERFMNCPVSWIGTGFSETEGWQCVDRNGLS